MKRLRKPAHPGRILRKHYIEPLGLTITKLAETLGVSRKAVSAIVNEKKRVTPDMALRLAKAFDTSSDLWANLQKTYDMWEAENKETGWKNVPKINMRMATV
jgi:addiction module HigA family antidote